MINPFFKNSGPFNIEKLLDKSGIENNENFQGAEKTRHRFLPHPPREMRGDKREA